MTFASYIITTNHMFWHEDIEVLDRPALEALQVKRLRATVRKLKRVPFYYGKFREAGLKPEDIQSVDDVRRLPFTTAADLRENYPDGTAGRSARRGRQAPYLQRDNRKTQGFIFLQARRGQRRRN